MKYVNQSLRKKDAMQLVTGQPVYTDDLAPKDCLIVKLLRSPYANAIVESVNTAVALKVPDIEAIAEPVPVAPIVSAPKSEPEQTVLRDTFELEKNTRVWYN